MKTKEELIQEVLDAPIRIGEVVKNGDRKYTVEKIEDDMVHLKSGTYSKAIYTKVNFIKLRDIYNIGHNPIKDYVELKNIGFPLNNIFYLIEKSRKEREVYFNEYVEGGIENTNFNPYVILENGEKFYYQRDLCWNLEHKQNLINSLYRGLDLGRVIIYERTYEEVERQLKKGNLETCFYDVIDGKQRLNTLIEWKNNKFPDSNGYYFKDLSMVAQRTLLSSTNLGFFKIETNRIEDILKVFLNNVVAGVPMDVNHVNKVQEVYNNLNKK